METLIPMVVFASKELEKKETRAALVPASVEKLVALGFNVSVESGIGACFDTTDAEYEAAGATIRQDRQKALKEAEIVLRVNRPELEEIPHLRKGALHLSFLDPFQEPAYLQAMAEAEVTAVSMEMMPRTTLSQKMDALSSQANLAGYFSVIKSAERLHKILPMMMTPAGTLSPARYFVIGVGVAGLQAIATAKRLGARVEAFDTRPVVEEQVKSLGAKFVKIDLGETGQTAQGYAKELTSDQIEKQRQGMAKICSESDVVITTAKLFGRLAPIIITHEMLKSMKRGSIVVDLAIESGGNVEGAKLDEEVVTSEGVRLLGIGKLEAQVPYHASQMYSSNLTHFLEHFWNGEQKKLNLDLKNEILQGCVLTHGGAIVHERFRA